MTDEEFLKLSHAAKLKLLKKARDYLSHDFQHQEIVGIESIDVSGKHPRITVWALNVDGENWPQFTDYFHRREQYDLIHGDFIFVTED